MYRARRDKPDRDYEVIVGGGGILERTITEELHTVVNGNVYHYESGTG